MENQQGKGIVFDKFTWKIENFSKLNTANLRSKVFKIYGYKWKICVHPLRKDVNHFSLYLTVADSLPPYGWSRNTYFKLLLINQMDPNKTVLKETQQKFNGGHRSWGSSFVSLSDFYDPKQGYLVKNTCIIEAHICVSDINPPKTIIQHSNSTKNIIVPTQQQTEPTPSHTEDQSTQCSSSLISSPTELVDEAQCSDLTLRDLIDVDSLGPEEAHFVPLLEEACTWHPSLIHSQKKRTRWFKLWAFTSLGQVLYFLKTKKVKDMDEEGCKQLQGLWEELVRSSGFELNWLEPYVQSAMGARGNLGKAEEVKKAMENVDALEIQVKKLKGELAEAEMELEVATRELEEITRGMQDIMDLNAGLGYAMF
ncbi:MATH domain and coiled-coil domain-containing protein [Senna tora]|uniref:MATH domain and coiled-coil domain-containing protein n=1 Tax=Senna tora TaxID=362788 RepID=A0A834WDU2_9FABA|nr:MATH domain and coiled-coil domain-containing protein [Senna tora]